MGEILLILTVLAGCGVLGARLMLTAKRPVVRIAGGVFVAAAAVLLGTMAICEPDQWRTSAAKSPAVQWVEEFERNRLAELQESKWPRPRNEPE